MAKYKNNNVNVDRSVVSINVPRYVHTFDQLIYLFIYLFIYLSRPSKDLRDKLTKDAKGFADKAKVSLKGVREESLKSLKKRGHTARLPIDTMRRMENTVSSNVPLLVLTCCLLTGEVCS